MGSLLQTISGALGGRTDMLARAIGADNSTTGRAVSAGLPLLLGALARRSRSEDGREAINAELEKDHGGLLDSLGGALGGGGVAGMAGALLGGDDRGDLLSRLLGGQRSSVEQAVSRASGLATGKTSQLLGLLAPVVLGALGRIKREQGLSGEAVSGLLRSEKDELERSDPEVGSGAIDDALGEEHEQTAVDKMTGVARRLADGGLGGLLGGRAK